MDKVQQIRIELNTARKLKIQKEKAVNYSKSLERSLVHETNIVKEDMDHYTQEMMDIQKIISETKYQLSMIDVCKVSEKSKIAAHLSFLQQHKNDFDDLSNIEKEKLIKHNQQVRDVELEKQELHKLKQMEVAKQNDEHLREAVSIELEIQSLNSECAILKKRNTAIMLKLRKKLLETENLRRELIKRNSIQANKNMN